MAFRPGTRANHDSIAVLYLAFAHYFQLVDLPAHERTLLCFAEFLLRSFSATKSVTNALSAVKRLHLDLGLPVEAFETTAVARWRRALPLTVRAGVQRAHPLSWEALERLCQAASRVHSFGSTLVALLSLLFHSMARVSSLLPGAGVQFDVTRHATRRDCQKQGKGYKFQVKWAKTHQHTDQAFWVPILPRHGSPACPVAALDHLLRGDGGGGSCPLFRVDGRPLAVPLARGWLRALLVSVGLQANAFTFHSFRRGSCTLAFARGAHIDDLKALGGWRSDSVALYRSAADARLRAANALVG